MRFLCLSPAPRALFTNIRQHSSTRHTKAALAFYEPLTAQLRWAEALLKTTTVSAERHPAIWSALQKFRDELFTLLHIETDTNDAFFYYDYKIQKYVPDPRPAREKYLAFRLWEDMILSACWRAGIDLREHIVKLPVR